MENVLFMPYPFVVMRLRGELHLLEENLTTAIANLPGYKAQVVRTEEEISFLRERIIELHAAINALED